MDPKKNWLALLGMAVLLAVAAWLFWPPQTQIRQGLDIQGGLSVILTAQPTQGRQVTPEAMQRTETILTERVNALGVSEATVQRQGDTSFLVQIPGIKDSREALDTIGKTGQLEFVDVASIEDSAAVIDIGQLDAIEKRGDRVRLKEGTYKPFMTGEVITGADVSVDEQQGVAVSLTMDSAGARVWSEYTASHVGQQVAIVLDGIVQSAPQVREAIPTGDTQISGNFTTEEAQRLAAVLEAGALPFTLKFSESRVVGPTLGRESLQQGLLAALVGLALVGVFMVVYYRVLGAIAALALALYGAVLLGTLAALSDGGLFAVTLPGVAGIILTIGVAADTSILIFERFKEELDMGRTYRTAAKSGSRHAIATSIDADVVTLVSALALYSLAIGPVRGFAFTLILGIVIDLVIALLFTIPVVKLLSETAIPKMPYLFGVKGGAVRG